MIIPMCAKSSSPGGLLCRSALALLLHMSRHAEHNKSDEHNTGIEQHEESLCISAIATLHDGRSMGSAALLPSTMLLYCSAPSEVMCRDVTASLGQQVTFSGRGGVGLGYCGRLLHRQPVHGWRCGVEHGRLVGRLHAATSP